ncbi:MAG: putative nucleotidyltransferase with HDIG domain [Gammaproteobacteria bacterium]|jgi:putative nucleotidyltransferase with HDIG domain
MRDVARVSARSRAEAFLHETGHISPAILKLGSGQERGLEIHELERLIATDPKFTLRVLSLANSAFYSQRYRIDSLRAALVVLGTGIVCRLAEGVLARKLVGSRNESRETFWLHCLAVGVGARLLAEAHSNVDPEQAFVAGLLHDIGLLACDNPCAHQDDCLSDDSRVREHCVSDEHSAIGAEIAELLDIPSHLCSAIHTHHDPACLQQDEHALEATVFKANVLAGYCGYANSRHPQPSVTGLGQGIDDFGLLKADAEIVSSRLHVQVAEMTAMLENDHPGAS